MSKSKFFYSGAGNSFVLLETEERLCPDRIRKECQEHRVDGLLQLLSSPVADARMRIFNCDGSEAEMCGNGLRCVIAHLNLPGRCLVETLAGMHFGECHDDGTVSITLSKPKDLKISAENNLHFVNTGVPHVVLFVEDLEGVDVAEQGKEIRHAQNANVNFVKIVSQELSIRTYERGVEAETLACGTGAAAAALIANRLGLLNTPIQVRVRSGERLTLFCDQEIWQRGPVKKMQEICQSLII